MMRNTAHFLLFAALLVLAAPASAQSRRVIRVDEAGGQRLRVAVQEFARAPVPEALAFELSPEELAARAEELHTALTGALEFSGVFALLPEAAFLAPTHTPEEYDAQKPDCAQWRQAGADALLQGALHAHLPERATTGVALEAHYRLYDVVRCRALLRRRVLRAPPERAARLGKVLADRAVRAFTGAPGVADTELAFVSERSGAREIWVTDANGDRPRRVTHQSSLVAFPSWERGGGALLFTSYHANARPQLFEMRRGARRSRHLLPALPAHARLYRGVYAPRGERIALVMSTGEAPDLYLADLAPPGERRKPRPPRRLTNNRSIEVSPSWSPDGRHLVYVSDRSGSPQLYIMRANGRGARRLTYDGTYNSAPAWSPDGRFIAYETRVRGQFDIWLIDPEGRVNRPLVSHRRSDEHPSWSPDGRKLAFHSTRRGRADIYILDLADSQVRRVTRTGENRSPAWGPYRSAETPNKGWLR